MEVRCEKVAIDIDTHRVIEHLRNPHDVPIKDVYRLLPDGVKSIKTILYYKDEPPRVDTLIRENMMKLSRPNPPTKVRTVLTLNLFFQFLLLLRHRKFLLTTGS